MEMFLTILVGVCVFVLGQAVLKIVIEPLQDGRRTIAKIRVEIIRNAHILHNAISIKDRCIKEPVFANIRELAAELESITDLVPFYSLLRLVAGLPTINKIHDASRNLIAVSNWMNSDEQKNSAHILKNLDSLIDNLSLNVDDRDRVDKETIQKLVEHALKR